MAKLGEVKSSEDLLKDLFVDLRKKTWKWAKITKQTPQARMGYVGQHLCSIVTGYEGGRTGARGADIIIPKTDTGEIKTCYRVDQLGSCNKCGAGVSTWEKICPVKTCKSKDIDRKDDSKWLLNPKSVDELKSLFAEKWIYLVLFEFRDVNKAEDIIVSIFQFSPHNPGFSKAIVDWFYNIRAKSESKAAFNLWPWMPKFHLMEPEMIYLSKISVVGSISTKIFPGRDGPVTMVIPELTEWTRSRGFTIADLVKFCKKHKIAYKGSKTKKDFLSSIEKWRKKNTISNKELAGKLASLFYDVRIAKHKALLP
jgi:hypothetical protein